MIHGPQKVFEIRCLRIELEGAIHLRDPRSGCPLWPAGGRAEAHMHMEKYRRFGVAFKKAFLVPKGARPVYYVPRTTFGYGAVDFSFVQRFFNAEAWLCLSAGPGGAVGGSSAEVKQLVKDLCWSAQPFPLP